MIDERLDEIDNKINDILMTIKQCNEFEDHLFHFKGMSNKILSQLDSTYGDLDRRLKKLEYRSWMQLILICAFWLAVGIGSTIFTIYFK